MPDATTLIAGRYRLGESLGQGGMGRVWLARDEVLQRDVAIKELLTEGLKDADAARRRTLREARAAARLGHPNVVQIYDVLEVDDRTWIVMEYVPSRSLQAVLNADGPLDPRRTARIGLELIAALKAAHKAGVDHRDVKPANVLLADDGRVLLTDFGIATIEGDALVSSADMLIGSPEYMSPERAKTGAAGLSSDLWSLGATLYAAVEGQSPFHRTSAIATLTALAADEPDPPRQAGPLEPLLLGLLQKDPADRIDASEAEHLLRAATSGSYGHASVVRVDTPPNRKVAPGDLSRENHASAALGAPVTPIPSQRPPSDPPPSAQPAEESPAAVIPANGPKAEGSDVESTPTEGAPGEDLQGVDAQRVGAQAGAAAAESQPAEIAPSENPSPGTRAAEAPSPEARPAEARSAEALPAGTRSAEALPAGTRSAEALPTGTRSAEALPAGTRPAEVAPIEVVPADPAPTAARGSHRTRLMLAVAVAVLLLAGVVWTVIRAGSDSAGDQTTADPPAAPASVPPAATSTPSAAPSVSASASASNSPSATPARTSAAASSAPATTAPGGSGSGLPALPDGWRDYKDPSGFAVYVPEGWTRSQEGSIVYFRTSGRVLGIDQTRKPQPDPVADWRSKADYRVSAGDFPSYREIHIKEVDYFRKAADWEFTFTRGGTRQHVNNRGVITATTQAYGFYWQTRDADWNRYRADLQLVFDSFRPARR
ncbi:protein kinase [Actinoplanes sp. NPDC049596]|uniref:protein kinase domain-containing protein n=1 Tax=unclassified Actinoplanes TaxID=2626549 RepID=UPI00343E569F